MAKHKTLDEIKALIRKLLAKADNTACSVEEAKTFNDKAYELMAEYNLARADLAEAEAQIVRTHRTLQVLKRPWSSQILHGLTPLYYCKWYFTRLSARMDTITIVGEESNVAVCHAVAVMVLRAVQQEARVHREGRSFMTGAGAVIYSRCKAMRPVEAIAAPRGVMGTTALVVLDNNEARENAAYIEKLIGGKLRLVSSKPKIKSADSYSRGAAFGGTVNLRGNLLGGR